MMFICQPPVQEMEVEVSSSRLKLPPMRLDSGLKFSDLFDCHKRYLEEHSRGLVMFSGYVKIKQNWLFHYKAMEHFQMGRLYYKRISSFATHCKFKSVLLNPTTSCLHAAKEFSRHVFHFHVQH